DLALAERKAKDVDPEAEARARNLLANTRAEWLSIANAHSARGESYDEALAHRPGDAEPGAGPERSRPIRARAPDLPRGLRVAGCRRESKAVRRHAEQSRAQR